ncbi:ubiquitin-like-specific protease 1D isoform X2 [Phalaenopsis equestris]|uniref:ubiquitin-like-specific protease 1D isoform X2 n=1 Tax=Phalaenopsis equestris TaxID=78828 RepID=UPI0009E528AC|nr:ubiquitin-like-specific protease 1D isoform X2 [Phalaenopsis equestris]
MYACFTQNASFPGTNASKADAAFEKELSSMGRDKHEGLHKVGLQMYRKPHQLHFRSQADEFLYLDEFSRCGANMCEQTVPSTSCRVAQSSSSCSLPQRKSSRLLSKRRKACLDWDLLDWEFEKVEDVVLLLDDEDFCGKSMDVSSDEWNDPESVALSCSDMECLNPEQFLSSPVMNFYILYLQRTEPTACRPQCDYHIFNTFFFGKLEKALSQKDDKSECFLKLRRWWKGVDIFLKAYILLPIHGSSHWSLVIISNPGKEDDSGLLILHLDSLGLHSSQEIFRIVSDFLEEEWNYVNQNPIADLPFRGDIWQHLPLRIEKKKVMVPQQKNKYDCGIFVLYFIKRFLEEAPQRLRKHDPSMFHSRWFKPAEASSLRKTIRDLLIEEFKKSTSLRVESSVCSNSWDIS